MSNHPGLLDHPAGLKSRHSPTRYMHADRCPGAGNRLALFLADERDAATGGCGRPGPPGCRLVAAAALRQRADDTLCRLEQFPESGRLIPEFPDLPYREVVVRPYRFFYRIKYSIVWIVAAWNGTQLPDKP